MNLLPIQISELTIGQPLSWDLFNQHQKKLISRGEILSNADEDLLKKSSLFRRQEETSISAKHSSEKSSLFKFQDMHLKVNDRLQIQLPTNIRGECCVIGGGFCKTRLLGYAENKTVLISMPQLAKLKNLYLLDGDQVTIQLFNGQHAFSFLSFIDRIIKSPIYYIHLSFPTEINGQLIRKSRRIKTNIVIAIANNPAPATITNLSMTGAEIRSNASFGQIAETISLSFTVEIFGANTTLSLQAIIRSIKPAANKIGDTIKFGIEFQELESEQSYALQSFVYQELVEHPENQA